MVANQMTIGVIRGDGVVQSRAFAYASADGGWRLAQVQMRPWQVQMLRGSKEAAATTRSRDSLHGTLRITQMSTYLPLFGILL